MKIRSGDKIKVIAGKEKDRGVEAEVLKVFPDSNKIIVKGVNVVKRHLKKHGTTPGQILEIEKSIDASNVMLVCPFTNKATKIGYVKIEDGKGKIKKFRFSKIAVKEKKGEPKDYIIK